MRRLDDDIIIYVRMTGEMHRYALRRQQLLVQVGTDIAVDFKLMDERKRTDLSRRFTLVSANGVALDRDGSVGDLLEDGLTYSLKEIERAGTGAPRA